MELTLETSPSILLGKRSAILQSNYIPWKGYFDLIHSVDEFILYDDVQYTRRDWRNRNRIKSPQGTQWLTIPVEVKGKYFQSIKDTRVADKGWAKRHWETLKSCYSKAPYFALYGEQIRAQYLKEHSLYLSEINRSFLEFICGLLGIQTRLSSSMEYGFVAGEKTDQLLELCRKASISHYVSGPAAKCYLDVKRFEEAGVGVSFFDYGEYRVYPQLFGGFEHSVTVLDLLFNVGPDTHSYMRTWTGGPRKYGNS